MKITFLNKRNKADFNEKLLLHTDSLDSKLKKTTLFLSEILD